MTLPESVFRPLCCFVSLGLVFASVLLGTACWRQRRFRLLLPALAVFVLSYLDLQAVFAYELWLWSEDRVPCAAARWLIDLPRGPVLALLAGCVVAVGVGFRLLYRKERSRITPASVKEAADSLPTGLCFYLPGGRIVLVNRAMEDLYRKLGGDYLSNGETFCDRLFSAGAPLPEGQGTVVTTADGAAWSVSLSESADREGVIFMLAASDVTELYRKTGDLRRMQSQLAVLNARLTAYYQEAADFTIQRETLEARVRLHDEMGTDLLLIQRFLQTGGSREEQAQIEARLRRSLSFLKAGRTETERDEYRMILQTAERLGVSVLIDGVLPQTQPHKHVLAAAIHECLTNTLRHAHGTQLRVRLTERDGAITAVFTNDGIQPTGPVPEQGGLRSLRTVTEQASGRMTVSTEPEFSVTLELPKEVPNAL